VIHCVQHIKRLPDLARRSCPIKVLRLAVVGAIERASVTEACFVAEVVRSSNEWSWLSLLAGLIALAIALDGLTAGAPIVIAMWVFLVALGHPLIAMGAAVGIASGH
jgi:branched-subunit amino acid transport protein